LSLAYPKEPVWAGCNHARDPETIAWYERTQMPLFSWSSQARGFFSGRFQPETLDNELIERVYAEPGNWERLRRAEELGRARGFSAIQVSLAWVLGQPFPVFPLIGPATVEELESCVEALDLELSAAERAWLDLQPLPTAERSLNG
jgi:aryl-alcohol dehydrogenase-like predicted oxidoreductase